MLPAEPPERTQNVTDSERPLGDSIASRLDPPLKIAALRVERLALADLKPHPRNPRKHPAPGSPRWLALKASLEHDYFDPLVLNIRNGFLVSGHLRLKVLTEAGFTHADVSIVDYDEVTHYARMMAANNPLGDWDDEIVSALAGDMQAAGLDGSLAGWDEKRFATAIGAPTVTDDTPQTLELVADVDSLQRSWLVRPGDLFAIGRHRLICGDARDHSNWALLLEGKLADMWWTDPPYNVAYEGVAGSMKNDDLSDADYFALLLALFTAAIEHTKPGGAIYVAHADSEGLPTRRAFEQAGWFQSQTLIWVKQAFTLTRNDYKWQHEPIIYGWKPGAGHWWQGGFDQPSVIDDEEKDLDEISKSELIAIIQRLRNERCSSVVREPRGASNELHPTVKPLPLVARQIWNSSHEGDTVGELCGGSGTTLLAAEHTGRRCVATELDPRFCAVILERAKRHGLPIEKLRDGPG